MNLTANLAGWTFLPVRISVIVSVIAVCAGFSEFTGPGASVGTVYASPAEQQKEAKRSAQEAGASESAKAYDALLENVPIDREYLRQLKEREEALKIRELEVAAKEKELQRLQSEIEQKLQQYQKVYADMQAVAQQIEEANKKGLAQTQQTQKAVSEAAGKKRDLEVVEAVKRYKAMAPATAAGFLIQMDVETAATIFKGLSPTQVGAIFDAMMEEVGTGKEAELKKKRMADIYERLVDSKAASKKAAVETGALTPGDQTTTSTMQLDGVTKPGS
jgi:flagellar motility protein MotE (MotC chaperone)